MNYKRFKEILPIALIGSIIVLIILLIFTQCNYNETFCTGKVEGSEDIYYSCLPNSNVSGENKGCTCVTYNQTERLLKYEGVN